jgi:hypothetical protein
MASMLSLLTVDIVGVLAALSIWTASFLMMLPSRVSPDPTRQHKVRR